MIGRLIEMDINSRRCSVWAIEICRVPDDVHGVKRLSAASATVDYYLELST